MRFLTLKLLTASVIALGLAGCVPTTPGVSPTVAPDASILPNAMHYAAVNDGTYQVNAVPVEKVPAAYQRQQVAFASNEPVGSIIISPGERHLYLITAKGKATQYGISVGKAGFEWSGVANITNRRNWPTWTPPKEMIERKPELKEWEKGMPGGQTNPLGARALYLTTNGVDYGYRIHGTPDWWTIGKNASSGCIRMINQDVMDLYSRVQDGAKVVVLNSDGSYPSKLKLPPKPATKAKATPKPAVDAPIASTIIVPKPSVMPTPVITSGTSAPAAPVVVPALPAAAPAVPAAPAEMPAAPAPTCSVALVNGVCPN